MLAAPIALKGIFQMRRESIIVVINVTNIERFAGHLNKINNIKAQTKYFKEEFEQELESYTKRWEF